MKNRVLNCGSGLIAVVVLSLCWFVVCSAISADPVAEIPSARMHLDELMPRANSLPEKDYTFQSWNEMRFALHEAQVLIKRQNATEVQMNAAAEKLDSSLKALARRTVVADSGPTLGLSASLFAIDPAGTANHVLLQWATSHPADAFELQRASNQAGPWKTIYTGSGTSFSDYSLSDGTYCYRVVAAEKSEHTTSNIASIETMKLPAGLAQYSNQQSSDEKLPGQTIQAGGACYKFQTFREGKALKNVLMYTSIDGRKWDDGSVVMDRNSHPDLADFKFESEMQFYDSIHDQIVWWCHWEKANGYGSGKAFVATAKPGKPFKVQHIYNPLGVEVRDMSVFVDDDKKGYLVAASNVPGQGANATLYIFTLNETYDDVTGIAGKVCENGYREAPHIVKQGGFYYVFFSQAAGWYPSQGGYVSAKSMDGPWTDPRAVGNSSTFSSQSGEVIEFGVGDQRIPVMMGSRWLRGDGTSHYVAMPIHFAEGFAFYDYSPALLQDASRNVLIPLQFGLLLSQDKPAESSIPGTPGHEAAKAFDGSYGSFFQSEQHVWPFTLTTDLGAAADIRNVQISWLIHKGSEAFYTYNIEGSLDGKEWTTLVNHGDAKASIVSKTYGFTSDLMPEHSTARHVRVKVMNAHLQNSRNNWYLPTVYEMKVYGDPRPEH